MKRLLVVSTDHGFAAALKAEAAQESWQAYSTEQTAATMRALYKLQPQAIVLDTDPAAGASGAWAIYQRIREVSDVPIVVIGGETTEERVAALKQGADDAVGKTCAPGEIMMRVQNLAQHRDMMGRSTATASYSNGILTIDEANRRLLTKDGTANLTPIEFRLLMRLVQEPDRCLSIRQLASALWHDPGPGQEKMIKVYIHRLRRKFRHCLPDDRYIINRRALGYRFR